MIQPFSKMDNLNSMDIDFALIDLWSQVCLLGQEYHLAGCTNKEVACCAEEMQRFEKGRKRFIMIIRDFPKK